MAAMTSKFDIGCMIQYYSDHLEYLTEFNFCFHDRQHTNLHETPAFLKFREYFRQISDKRLQKEQNVKIMYLQSWSLHINIVWGEGGGIKFANNVFIVPPFMATIALRKSMGLFSSNGLNSKCVLTESLNIAQLVYFTFYFLFGTKQRQESRLPKLQQPQYQQSKL